MRQRHVDMLTVQIIGIGDEIAMHIPTCTDKSGDY
jgi:hypothetical protein